MFFQKEVKRKFKLSRREITFTDSFCVTYWTVLFVSQLNQVKKWQILFEGREGVGGGGGRNPSNGLNGESSPLQGAEEFG